jgi:hypothetical protein
MTRSFELPDLLVTLCEKGELSLAAKLARALLGAPAPGAHKASAPREHGGVAGDKRQTSTSVEPLERDFPPPCRRR